MENHQPGQVVTPQQSPAEPVQPQTGAPTPERPQEAQPAPPPPNAYPETSEAATSDPEPASWQFTSETSAPHETATKHTPSLHPDATQSLTWTASEFIAHEKSGQWYAVLALVGIVGTAVMYLLTKDKISAGITLFVAVAFGAFAGRKPQVQQYVMSTHSLLIGGKEYLFQNFKSFSINEEGAIVSVVFMPLKRFMPALTIYVVPDMEEQVVTFLSGLLPFEQRQPDAVDTFLKRIRF